MKEHYADSLIWLALTLALAGFVKDTTGTAQIWFAFASGVCILMSSIEFAKGVKKDLNNKLTKK